MGTRMDNSATLPISWCALTALGGYLWAKKLYDRPPSECVIASARRRTTLASMPFYPYPSPRRRGRAGASAGVGGVLRRRFLWRDRSLFRA